MSVRPCCETADVFFTCRLHIIRLPLPYSRYSEHLFQTLIYRRSASRYENRIFFFSSFCVQRAYWLPIRNRPFDKTKNIYLYCACVVMRKTGYFIRPWFFYYYYCFLFLFFSKDDEEKIRKTRQFFRTTFVAQTTRESNFTYVSLLYTYWLW